MKHIDEIQLGGFRTDNILWNYISGMIQERDELLSSIYGDKKILTGVIVDTVNDTVTSGIVVYNGKLYSFSGGDLADDIAVKKTNTLRPNLSGIDAPAFYEDVMEFGTDGVETFPFSDLTRWYSAAPQYKEIKFLGREVTNDELVGTGWFVADGTNGTDDWSGLFPVGAGGGYSINDTGGENEVTLTEEELAPHSHTGTVQSPAESPNTGTDVHFNIDGNNREYITKSLSIDSAGGGDPHENRPPYRAARVIQFIGL